MSANFIDDWEFDKFDDGSLKIVGDVQLRKYGRFAEDYSAQLRAIETALDDSLTEAWDLTLDPIALQLIPVESSDILHLIHTDNKIFNKIITVLSSLCHEIEELKFEAKIKFNNALLFYGEGYSDDCGDSNSGMSQILMARMLPLLQELSCFINRCYEVVKNVVHQLASLYFEHKGIEKVMDIGDVHFIKVFESLGDLLSQLLTFDEIISQQTILKEHWILYKRMVKSVHHNPSKVGIDIIKLKPFEKLLMSLEGQLLDGTIYQNCVEQIFDDGRAIVSKNATFEAEFSYSLRTLFEMVEARLGETGEMEHRLKYVSVCTLFVLHYQIFRVVDKKLFKSLWDIHKKVPAITLTANVIWFPTYFLSLKLTKLVQAMDKKAQQNVETARQTYLQMRSQALSKESQTWYLQVSIWMVRMQRMYEENMFQELNDKCNLFLQGLLYAYGIRNLVSFMMNLHAKLEKPITKSNALSLCRLLELLKAIEHTFHKESMFVADCVHHITQYLTYSALTIIHPAKKRVFAGGDKKFSKQRLDVLAAFVLLEQLLSGPSTKERRIISKLALSVAMPLKSLKEDDILKLQTIFRKLDCICDLRAKLKEATDCSFFYWHRAFFSIYLEDIYEQTLEAHRLHYMSAVLKDCVVSMRHTHHLEDSNMFLEYYEREINNYLRVHLLEPLCRDVEVDLRLHIHSHLQLDERNPYKTGKVKDLAPLLSLKPIRFFDTFINIKCKCVCMH